MKKKSSVPVTWIEANSSTASAFPMCCHCHEWKQLGQERKESEALALKNGTSLTQPVQISAACMAGGKIMALFMPLCLQVTLLHCTEAVWARISRIWVSAESLGVAARHFIAETSTHPYKVVS